MIRKAAKFTSRANIFDFFFKFTYFFMLITNLVKNSVVRLPFSRYRPFYSRKGQSSSICLKLTYFIYFFTLNSNLTEKSGSLTISEISRIFSLETVVNLLFFFLTHWFRMHYTRTRGFFGASGKGVWLEGKGAQLSHTHTESLSQPPPPPNYAS